MRRIDISAGTEVSSSIDSKPIDDLNSAKLIDVKTSKSIASNHTAKTEDTNGKESCETDPLNALRRQSVPFRRSRPIQQQGKTILSRVYARDVRSYRRVCVEYEGTSRYESVEMSLIDLMMTNIQFIQTHFILKFNRILYVPPPNLHLIPVKIPAWLRRNISLRPIYHNIIRQEHTFSHHRDIKTEEKATFG